MSTRSTIDVWYIFVNYGDGFGNKSEDAECTELGYYQFLNNKRAYEQNCQYPIRTRKGRMKKTDLPGGWNYKQAMLTEAKAEVEFFQTTIKQLGTNDKRELRLKRAEEKLARLSS